MFGSRSTWGDILALLKDFLKDSRHSAIAQSTALVDLSAFAALRSFARPADALNYGDRAFVQRLLHYARFANAAYGWSLFSKRNIELGVLKSAAVFGRTNDPNRAILMRHCRLRSLSDIVEDKWASTQFDFATG